ncbi:MAG TPA: DNA primase [Opitutaceae bacterium]|nr:DNA primase [Opitutaceae bacterium]
MPAIKPTCVRDLKVRVNIVDVVSRVVSLKKAGARFRGLCPFHQEKTPSFHVDPDKGFYKCFGCGKAGDVIRFVQDTEQLSFVEAVEALGQRFNVPIEYEDGGGPTREERSLRQELFELHEVAAEHFHQRFKEKNPTGDFMREYWRNKRRFPDELADEFKIGAAEPNDVLASVLWKRKFSDDALRQSGLFFVREGAMLSVNTLRPRFRGRLMIPIRDHQGRVVAFTARQTDLTPADDPAREAKYVNSPETPIFTKGHLLFNLDRARTNVGEGKAFLLVEGQLDALRCWQVGIKTAIAPQGTSITDSQLVLARRYHPEVECFFDSDSAGQKAALRFLPMALKAGLEVRFLGGGAATKVDPDLLFLERGAEAYQELKRTALSGIGFACRSLLPAPDKASAEQKARTSQSLFEIISAAESEIVRAEFLNEAARHLRLPVATLQRDFEQFRRRETRQAPSVANTPDGVTTAAKTNTSASVKTQSPEHHLLYLCLHFEKIGKPLSLALPHDWIDTSHPAGLLLNRLLGEFEQDAWPGRDQVDTLLETPEEKTLVASLLFDTPEIEDPIKVANEGLRQLRARALEPRLRQIELALATYAAESNVDAISLIKERTKIQQTLRNSLGLSAPA